MASSRMMRMQHVTQGGADFREFSWGILRTDESAGMQNGFIRVRIFAPRKEIYVQFPKFSAEPPETDPNANKRVCIQYRNSTTQERVFLVYGSLIENDTTSEVKCVKLDWQKFDRSFSCPRGTLREAHLQELESTCREENKEPIAAIISFVGHCWMYSLENQFWGMETTTPPAVAGLQEEDAEPLVGPVGPVSENLSLANDTSIFSRAQFRGQKVSLANDTFWPRLGRARAISRPEGIIS